MVDELRVLRLLRSMSDDVAFLETRRSESPERRDEIWLRAVKYSVVTAAEAAIDVAQHICAAEGWGPPDTNADCFRLLAAHDAIGHDLADALARASGFRNVLVHDYVAVDDRIVVANLDNLSDFGRFAADVANWLAAQS